MRLPKLRTVSFILGIIRNNYLFNSTDSILYRRFARNNEPRQRGNERPVLIQASQDYYYFGLFGEIVTAMRRSGPLHVDQYTVSDLRGGSSLSPRRLFWNLLTTNIFSDWKWQRLYGSFADRVAYRAAACQFPWVEFSLWRRAFHIWRNIRGIDDLAALSVGDILIGDLVIDSYIRFKPSPAVALDDWYLLVVIRQALKNLRCAQRYMRSTSPRLVLTSYTTYIRHGIPARVAAALGIRVLSFGNIQELSKDITASSLQHTKDGTRYKQDFLALDDQEQKRGMAEKALSARTSGIIDKATSYMKASSYGSEREMVLDVRGMPIIFLHDFYDSAHGYRWILFHDFWTWACFTIETLRNAGIPFAIKPHPNQVADSDDVISQLRKKYPDINVIPAEISNRQLVQSGMACAITVYGTVASEMAYLGIPTISCGDNPHVSFDFSHTARSMVEYETRLVNIRNLDADKETMRAESCAFYYMHVLNYESRDIVLSDKASALRGKLFYASPPPPADEIVDALDQFGHGPEFRDFCTELNGNSLNAEVIAPPGQARSDGQR